MVLLTVTRAAKAAIEECRRQCEAAGADDALPHVAEHEVGEAISHQDIIDVSLYLKKAACVGKRDDSNRSPKSPWRLDALLKGAKVYNPPPPPKRETTLEYKALMTRLREEEERQAYERMTKPVPKGETLDHLSPRSRNTLGSAPIVDQRAPMEVEEVTYQDVDRQVALIINVLVSIVACSIGIWVVARHWAAPQRLALSMSGSGIVAMAEVAIYMGYIRRIKDAKHTEAKKMETKEILETWVIDGAKPSSKLDRGDELRQRKGKHR